MQKYTGTIILGIISAFFLLLASVFGIDSVLATGDHATISEWVYNFIQSDPTTGLIVLFGGFGTICLSLLALIFHFIYFKPKK